MAEPQIKAKLVLDTSALNNIKGGSGIPGVQSTESKKDSKALKTMSDAITGPIKTSALMNIKILLPAVAAMLAAQTIVPTVNDIADELNPFSNLGGETAQTMLDDGLEESTNALIDELTMKQQALEDAGDWEGAAAIRDEINVLKYNLEQVKKSASNFNKDIEDAGESFDGIPGFIKSMGDLAQDIGVGLGLIDKDVSGDDDGIKGNTGDVKSETKLWVDNLIGINLMLGDVKKEYALMLDEAKKRPTFGTGRFDGAGAGGSWGEPYNNQDETGKASMLLALSGINVGD